MSIDPIPTINPSKDIDDFDDTAQESIVEGKQEVHIRIQQRNGRKCLTLVQGLPPKLDQQKVLRYFKHKFCCNGKILEDEKAGKVMQMQGDQRNNVLDFLVNEKIVTKDQIKVHGAI